MQAKATCKISQQFKPYSEKYVWVLSSALFLIQYITCLMENQVSQQLEMQELQSNTETKYAGSLHV